MKKLLPLLTGFALTVACNTQTDHSEHRTDGYSGEVRTPEDSLFKLVMDGHDTGMAGLGKLRNYQKQIQLKIDSIGKLPASAVSENYKATVLNIQEELNYAEYGMNTWMEEFNSDSAKEDQEARLEYLKNEQEKVERVKNNIQTSIQRADSLLKR